MERSALLTILFALLFSPATRADAPDDSWRPIREGEKISVYKRDVEDSKFDESLAQTAINVRLSALVALIMDGDSLEQWIDTVKESRQLEVLSPTEVYNYTVSGAPWPVKDRDAVVLTRAAQDSESLVVTITSSAKPEHIPERDGTVRVPFVESTWTLVPQPDGSVEVNYQVHNDPGGEIPTWLINSLASDQPYKTLENLHRFFADDNDYSDAMLPFIQEPGA
ncbi:MAG: START domain-containing protein [Gammaproteobacteria bacterium]|nr:START domain-containing protein [Gammaproteobacteria bacterium]NNL99824.1 START domain-containing protein [Gammaproteobacteria bacterium]